jgi:hypothetical protein
LIRCRGVFDVVTANAGHGLRILDIRKGDVTCSFELTDDQAHDLAEEIERSRMAPPELPRRRYGLWSAVTPP